MAQIDSLFQSLINQKGSDLHLQQDKVPLARINGHLTPLNEEILSADRINKMLSELLSEERWQYFQKHGDLDFAYELGGTARFRANYFRHFFGLGAIFRLIPSVIRSFEELSLPEKIKDFAKFRKGLVFVTGPTGSGKSTTLAALIDYINTNYEYKIITLEEPLEFVHQNKKSIICHREVGRDTQSFTNGLRTAIKSDANVILVGEMRDRETMELALNASEMGILVFATLHTNCAAKTIDRIIDTFPTNRKNQIRTILANNLNAIVAQQLLPDIKGSRRWGAYEILIQSSAISNLIQNGEVNKLSNEIQVNKAAGMILMDNCLMELVTSGKVSKQDAYFKAIDKNRFI